MKRVLFLAALLCGPAMSEDDGFLRGAELQAEVTAKCAIRARRNSRRWYRRN